MGFMTGSGEDDYDIELEVVCPNDDECDFSGSLTAVVKSGTAYTECPVCLMPIEREV